jgi:hypothetical protein
LGESNPGFNGIAQQKTAEACYMLEYSALLDEHSGSKLTKVIRTNKNFLQQIDKCEMEVQ